MPSRRRPPTTTGTMPVRRAGPAVGRTRPTNASNGGGDGVLLPGNLWWDGVQQGLPCSRYLDQASQFGWERMEADPEHKQEHMLTVLLANTQFQFDFSLLGGRCTHNNGTTFNCPHIIQVQEVDGHHVRVCGDDCRKHLALCGPKKPDIMTSKGVKDSWDFRCLIESPVLHRELGYWVKEEQMGELLRCYEMRCLAH